MTGTFQARWYPQAFIFEAVEDPKVHAIEINWRDRRMVESQLLLHVDVAKARGAQVAESSAFHSNRKWPHSDCRTTSIRPSVTSNYDDYPRSQQTITRTTFKMG